ncbi:MAG TPA: hypothetical protein VE998_12035 [Terriglobales bacterium]|nr:hypothetical protein [Terriglobales bacterium]
MIRNTPLNIKALRTLATALDLSFSQPYYPASDLYRLVNDETGLQLDFMTAMHGVRSFESLCSAAVEVSFRKAKLHVADLKDIIRSQRALGRRKDLAGLELLEATQDEKERQKKGKAKAGRGE